jgi:CO dehydrogenase maturation factor
MKIAVAGKGGSGKTTVSATLARELARAGHSVLALDADTNPMLGISLGVGPEETYRLLSVRQGLDDGSVEHEHSAEGLIEAFGTDAPDGVRLVVALREDRIDPGCVCCGGITPQQLLGELEGERRTVICDLEAGVGAVVHGGKADMVLVVAEPSAKSIDVARRAAVTASGEADVIVIANRVRGEADLDAIRAALGGYEIVVVPEDPAIVLADQEGRAPLDVDAASPAVNALRGLANRLDAQPAAA